MDEKKNKFIILGNTRIKVGNIKNYGIACEKERITHEKVYKREIIEHGILSMILLGRDSESVELTWEGEWRPITQERAREWEEEELRKCYKNEKGEFIESDEYADEDSILTGKSHYLYITTFQKDNFKFFENEVGFNIYKKCSELDALLS